MANIRKYDVCLSFAGEDRAYVKRVADELTAKGMRVFYDEYEKAQLWGKDLYSHLDDVYQNAARYCIVFLSKHYAVKIWTNHERKSAQARAIQQHAEYILPTRFDDTKIDGIRKTVGYIDLRTVSPAQLSELVLKKLGPRQTKKFLPPNPDRLFNQLKARSSAKRERITFAARSFFETLERMSPTERRIVFKVFDEGCPTELPENIHISLDLLRRALRSNVTKILRNLSGLSSLGFSIEVREGHREFDTDDPTLVLEWHDTHVANSGNYTAVVDAMIKLVTENYCSECGDRALQDLDFGQLATATKVDGSHR